MSEIYIVVFVNIAALLLFMDGLIPSHMGEGGGGVAFFFSELPIKSTRWAFTCDQSQQRELS